jgi:putative tricarboxylic transport membrane protein
MISLFLSGLAAIMTFKTILLMMFGTILGLIFGAIPGLSAAMAVALMLPATFTMDTIQGMAVLISLYVGGISGGLISAILLRIPGTPSSIATCFDGYPMTQNGRAGKAIGTGVIVSFIGGILSLLILMFAAPPLASIAIKFGPFEYFSLTLFALTIIATLSSGSFIMGILSGAIGILITFVGMAPVDGVDRFTLGMYEFKGGFSLLPVLIGLFAITEILKEVEQRVKIKMIDTSNLKGGGFGLSIQELKEQAGNLLRSGLIGTVIGILPGIGGSTASVMSYGEAKRASKHPEKFGTGIIDGIVASETANNAVTGGALVPLLTLGIPGDSVTAILLGGLMIHGVQPGPLLFKESPDVVYGVFAALFVANIMFVIFEYFGINLFIKVLKIPKHILLPIVFILCCVGAFAVNNRMFDVWTLIGFGIIGFVLDKCKIQMAPLVIGFILGPMAETNFRRALMLSQGSFTPFFTKPISLFFIIAAVLSMASIAYRTVKEKKKAKENVTTA